MRFQGVIVTAVLAFAGSVAFVPIASRAHAQVSVSATPPQPQNETQPARPSARHVWIPGFWYPYEGQYVWVGGHWAVPPERGAVWHPPTYERRGELWFITPGEWIPQVEGAAWIAPSGRRPSGWTYSDITPTPAPDRARPTAVTVPPPAIRIEAPTARPSVRHVWLPGYWEWDGSQYMWITGRWDLPRLRGMVWIAPRWRERGDGWIFVPGRWSAAPASVRVR